MCFAAESFFETSFDGGGTVVNGGEGQVAVHAHVGFDGDAVADAAGAQVVGLLDVGE